MKTFLGNTITSLLSYTLLLSLLASVCAADPLVLGQDQRASLAVFQYGKYQILSEFSAAQEKQCGSVGDIPVPGNFLRETAGRIAVWSPSYGLWHVCADGVTVIRPWGVPGDIPVPADYDGDTFSDYAVFRPSTGEWFILSNSGELKNGDVDVFTFGLPGDIPVPADYKGEGRAIPAIFRSEAATGGTSWLLRTANGAEVETIPFGLLGDIPVPGDYNGDDSDQIAVFRPGNGLWFVLQPDGQTIETVQFGLRGDIPSPADVDGDGKVDRIVYRPSTASWFVSATGGNGLPGQITLGQAGARVANDSRAGVVDRPAVLDFNGDRLSDLALVRTTEENKLQFLFHSGSAQPHPRPLVQFGVLGDTLAPGDYDGDGTSDLAAVRVEGDFLNWHLLLSSSQQNGRSELILTYGLLGDQIIPGDYDGDHKTDLAVVRNMPDGSKLWLPNHSGFFPLEPVSWGFATDTALTADLDGDKKSDYIVVREIGGQLMWLVRSADGEELEPILFGLVGDQAIVGDFNGDSKAEIGVARQVGSFKMILVRGLEPYLWGLSSDASFAGNYTGADKVSSAVWRVVNGQGFFFIRAPGASAFGLPFGVSGDLPLRPFGVTQTGEAVADDSGDGGGGGSGPRLNCTSRTSARSQESGFVWKPVSEGDGKLVVLFGSSRAGSVRRAALVDSTADGDVVLETLRFVGNTNGGRPTFRAERPGRSYPDGVILIRQSTDNSVHCIDVPEPGNRYD